MDKLGLKFTIHRRWHYLAILLLFALASPAFAQEAKTTGFFLLPTKDSVYILVPNLPATGIAGFVAYRTEKGSSDSIKLTPSPIINIKDTAAAQEAIGEKGMTEIYEAMKVKSLEELNQDYEKSREKYTLFTLFSLNLNKLFGRLYIDKDVTPGGSYIYKIALVDSSGRETKTFAPREIKVEPQQIQAPTGFKLESKDGAATLTWDAQPEKYKGIGWDIYRSESKEGQFIKANSKVITVLGEPKFYEMLLENDKIYYYYVVGVDLVGNTSTPTQILEAAPKDMTPPDPPANASIELVENTKVRLTWDMNLAPDLAGYSVFRGPQMEAKEYQKITNELLPPDQTEFVDDTLKEGDFYFYRLTATDKTGNESANSVTVSLQRPDLTPPDAPLKLTATPKDTALLITWEINKEADLFGYYLYRGDSPEKMDKLNQAVIEATKTEYIDYGVVSGEKYYYTLVAVDNSFNESERSAVIEVIAPDSIPPSEPSGLFAQAEDTKVTLSWPKNMEGDLAGYRLYRSESEDGSGEYIREGNDISATATTYIDGNVQNGKIYWYYLTAFDVAGNEGAPSDKVVAKPRDDTPPEPPAGLTGEPTESGVNLTWSLNPEKDIAGYRVWRSEIKTGIYETISGNELLSPTSNTYSDTIIDEIKTYWYSITAVDTSENESPRSSPAGPLTKLQPEPTAPEEGETKEKQKKE